MILVADMSPLHYLILIGAEQILPRLFVRVLTPPAVIAEMSRADTPERVRDWASSPPAWIQVKQPTHIEEIPSLGRKGDRGAGEKAAISLACEEGVSIILMDDKIGRKEAVPRGLRPLWMLAYWTRRLSAVSSKISPGSSSSWSGIPRSTSAANVNRSSRP